MRRWAARGGTAGAVERAARGQVRAGVGQAGQTRAGRASAICSAPIPAAEMGKRMDGKVVLVTGAGSGIGLAAAAGFAALGASVRALGRDEDRAAQAAELARQRGTMRRSAPMTCGQKPAGPGSPARPRASACCPCCPSSSSSGRQLAELDLRRPFGLACPAQPDLTARQRIDPGVHLHAPGSAGESLYVSGRSSSHDIDGRSNHRHRSTNRSTEA